jgi:hypothetical protein
MYLFFAKKGEFLKCGRESPKSDINSAWSLHIGSFWRIQFITYSKRAKGLAGRLI